MVGVFFIFSLKTRHTSELILKGISQDRPNPPRSPSVWSRGKGAECPSPAFQTHPAPREPHPHVINSYAQKPWCPAGEGERRGKWPTDCTGQLHCMAGRGTRAQRGCLSVLSSKTTAPPPKADGHQHGVPHTHSPQLGRWLPQYRSSSNLTPHTPQQHRGTAEREMTRIR